MDQDRGIHYKQTCFEYPEVTPIHGEPILGPFLVLEGEIKANALLVHTSLGDGRHMHLGIACKPAIYNAIEDTEPYERPKNPGVLKIVGGITFKISQKKS